MALLLTVVQCPNSSLGEQRLIQASGFMLGRGSECDWTLADPERRISNQHCSLEFSEGNWLLRDLSTNGTFLNNAPAPIGRGQMRPLHDGDRVRLGAYVLECRVQHDAEYGATRRQSANINSTQIAASAQSADIFSAPLPGLSPLGGMDRGFAQLPPSALSAMPPMQPSRDADIFSAPLAGFSPAGAVPNGLAAQLPRERPLSPGMPPSADDDIFSAPLPGLSPAGGPQGGHAPLLPTDFDPFGAEDAGPVMPDHQPVVQDVFTPPRATMPDLLPGDWDAMPQTGAAPQADIGSAPVQAEDFSPFAPLEASLGMAAASLNKQVLPISPQAQMTDLLPDDWDLSPLAAPASSGAPGIPATPMANLFAATSAPMPAVAQPIPTSAHLDPQRAAPLALADTQATMAPLDAPIGIGLQPPAPPLTTQQPMSDHQTALVLLSAAVAGMRALLTTSEGAQRSLGNTQSILPSNPGDPLRFAANDQALAMALLAGVGAPTGPSNPTALAGTVDDLNAHKLATMAASKAAARALLARLAPAMLEAEVRSGGFMPGAREKRLWKGYKKLHQQLAEAFDDDFDFAFRKAFASAYDEACKIVDRGSR